MTPEEIALLVGFFTRIDGVEFFETVRAGDKVACMASFEPEGYFREGKLVNCIEFQFDGGMWGPKHSPRLG